MRACLWIAITGALLSGAATADAHGDGRAGGKLLLTNGVATVEGSGGGGVSTWALIAGNETRDGIGGSAHVSVAFLPDYRFQSHGVAIGLWDRLELSYARQNLDTRDVGAALGIGRGAILSQDVFGAKLRLFGDAVYDSPWLPQVAVGVQHKRSLDAPIAAGVGARDDRGTDIYVAATKLLLRHSLLVGAAVRRTAANQTGLLGHGGAGGGAALQVEGSVGWQLSRRTVIGVEYRTKPDNLGFAREDDWATAYLAHAITRNVTATVALVDLGSIATADDQRGVFLSLQGSF